MYFSISPVSLLFTKLIGHLQILHNKVKSTTSLKKKELSVVVLTSFVTLEMITLSFQYISKIYDQNLFLKKLSAIAKLMVIFVYL